ncbi:IS3 family transposase [Tissierella pigra]|uniref:Transposase n=1 Tax=Tissierella pigra TaxID=2607614 RepID=A0A6N7XJB4_9FIRM|nr:IS3 family transposase [Tissierella pigra]MSU01686.1 transposase [Tissierella pigra]
MERNNQKNFDENKGKYGSIRIVKVLGQRGIHINHNRISRLMRKMNLCPKGTPYLAIFIDMFSQR